MAHSDRFDIVDIEYESIEHDTGKAVLLKIEGDEFWIPKSQIKNDYENEDYIQIPRWLVDEKHLS